MAYQSDRAYEVHGMVERVPPEVEAKYTKYLKVKEVLDTVSQERLNIEATIAEISSILESLEKLGDDVELFKLMGYVLVKTTKDSLMSELRDRKEELEARLLTVKRQENQLREELERLSSEIRELLSGRTGAGAGG